MKKKSIRKLTGLVVVVVMVMTTLASCGQNKDQIYVVTREEGSGTRTAFAELAGVTDKEGRDIITQQAEVTNSTAVMLQTIAGNKNAIGYVSLGSLSEDVKAVKVEGIPVNIETIKNGEYEIARPFNIVTKSEMSEVTADFIEYILSKEGQKIVEKQGYIKDADARTYQKKNAIKGKITIAGSTSVAPVIEVIAASYMEMYPEVKIEIQQSGSSAGVIAVNEGVSDIGLASRELKGEENRLGLKSTKIAMDGIVVIVNKENIVENMSKNDIKRIFSGQSINWNDN